MKTEKIKGTLTQGKDMKLTLRIWLNEDQKELFVLEKGKMPKGLINVIVMNKDKKKERWYK